MFRFRSLNDVPGVVIVDALNDAFANYPVAMQMTGAKLDFMLRERSVRLEHSFGLFDQDLLCGLVLNGSRSIEGVKTAYDAGTGTRVAYQRKGHGAKLLQQTIKQLSSFGYQRYLLEVLTDNTPAVGLYRQHGFAIQQELACYKASCEALAVHTGIATSTDLPSAWPNRFSALRQYQPSWQNSDAAVTAVGERCRLIAVMREQCPCAYAVLVAETGNIMQIGWDDEQAVAALLGRCAALAATAELRIVNVPTLATTTERVLLEHGFRRFVTQYEMALELDHA